MTAFDWIVLPVIVPWAALTTIGWLVAQSNPLVQHGIARPKAKPGLPLLLLTIELWRLLG